jgi:RNA polymerase sigma-70 factor (ECF subfamily)
MPEVHRVILLMYYFEERSYKEIAEELDIPLGTVMSRLARARDKMKQLLEEQGPA